MADILEMSQTGYAKFEKSKPENISLSVAVRIARALDIKFIDLFDIEDNTSEGQEEKLRAKIKELNEKILQLENTITLAGQLLQLYKQSNIINEKMFSIYVDEIPIKDGSEFQISLPELRKRATKQLLDEQPGLFELKFHKIDLPIIEEQKNRITTDIDKLIEDKS